MGRLRGGVLMVLGQLAVLTAIPAAAQAPAAAAPGTAAAAGLQPPTQAQQDAIRSNCRRDFLSNCSGVPRGGKEALQCLKANQAKLSAGCAQAVAAVN